MKHLRVIIFQFNPQIVLSSVLIINYPERHRVLTPSDMLHIHAVHQPAAGVYVVEPVFLG